jgi:hypothetical protein
MPSHDHLWFIVGPGDFPDTYLTTDYTQVSVLREIDGLVRVIMPDSIALAYEPTQFPVPLEGTDFEELVESIRELAPGSITRAVLARRSTVLQDDVNRWAAC